MTYMRRNRAGLYRTVVKAYFLFGEYRRVGLYRGNIMGGFFKKGRKKKGGM